MWTETQRAPSTIIASRGKVGRNLRKCLWAYSSDRSGRNVTWDRNVSHVNANYLPPTLPNRWRQKEQSIVDIILPVSVLSLLSHFRRLFLCKHDATATKTEVGAYITSQRRQRRTESHPGTIFTGHTCSSGDVLADKHTDPSTDRHAHHNNLLPTGGGGRSNHTSLAYCRLHTLNTKSTDETMDSDHAKYMTHRCIIYNFISASYVVAQHKWKKEKFSKRK